MFWVLFVNFLADFFFRLFWEGGKNRGRVLFGCCLVPLFFFPLSSFPLSFFFVFFFIEYFYFYFYFHFGFCLCPKSLFPQKPKSGIGLLLFSFFWLPTSGDQFRFFVRGRSCLFGVPFFLFFFEIKVFLCVFFSSLFLFVSLFPPPPFSFFDSPFLFCFPEQAYFVLDLIGEARRLKEDQKNNTLFLVVGFVLTFFGVLF